VTAPAHRQRTWSFSALNQLAGCGERFRLERIIGVPTRPNVSAVGGTAVHAATALIELGEPYSWKDELEKAVAEEEAGSGLARENFRTFGRATKDRPNGDDLKHWADTLGPDMIDGYLKWMAERELLLATGLPPDKNDNTTGVEYDLKVELPSPMFGTLGLRGILDRVFLNRDGGHVVIDVKSGSRQALSLQLPAYKIAFERHTGSPVVGAAYWMTRRSKLLDRRQLEVWTERRFVQVLEKYEQQERTGVFMPVVDDHCQGFCPVQYVCRFGR